MWYSVEQCRDFAARGVITVVFGGKNTLAVNSDLIYWVQALSSFL